MSFKTGDRVKFTAKINRRGKRVELVWPREGAYVQAAGAVVLIVWRGVYVDVPADAVEGVDP